MVAEDADAVLALHVIVMEAGRAVVVGVLGHVELVLGLGRSCRCMFILVSLGQGGAWEWGEACLLIWVGLGAERWMWWSC